MHITSTMARSPSRYEFFNSGGTHPAIVRLSGLPRRARRDLSADELDRVCNIYIDAAHSALEASGGSRYPVAHCLIMLGMAYDHAVTVISPYTPP